MDALLDHLPLIVPLVIVQLLLMIIAVIDLIRIENERSEMGLDSCCRFG